MLPLLLCFCIIAFAQTERISEKEVMVQKLFIEANKEKILGNYETSASLYREVLGKNPRNDAAAYELARVYDVMDQDKDALSSINIAVTINPVNDWYQMFKSDILEKQKDYIGAAGVYEDLIKYFPKEDYYYYKQAYYLVKGNEPDKAIKVYNLLEKSIGITGDLTKKKFNLYMGLDNQKKATQELVKLVKAYPSDIEYRLDLAQFYTQINRADQAKKEFENILKIDPNNGEAGIMLASRDQTAKGSNPLAPLEKIFSNPETGIDVKMKEFIPIIQNIAEKGDLSLAKEATALAQILENTHPNEAKAYAAYGDLLNYTGNRTAAKEKYKKAIQLDKTVFNIWEQLLFITEAERNYGELVKISNDAQVFFPNQSTAYYFSGIGEFGLGNYERAKSAFKRTLIMSRRDPLLQFDTQHRLMLVHTEMENWAAVKDSYEKATAQKADHPGLISSYALALAKEGKDLNKAEDLVSKADKIAPNNYRVQRIFGEVLLAKGDLKSSQNWLLNALSNKGEKDPETLETYGDLLLQMKNLEEAKTYWQKAIDFGGNESILKRKIAQPETAN